MLSWAVVLRVLVLVLLDAVQRWAVRQRWLVCRTHVSAPPFCVVVFVLVGAQRELAGAGAVLCRDYPTPAIAFAQSNAYASSKHASMVGRMQKLDCATAADTILLAWTRIERPTPSLPLPPPSLLHTLQRAGSRGRRPAVAEALKPPPAQAGGRVAATACRR